MKKKKGKNNAVKKFPIYKGLIVFAVIFLAMLVFLNNKYDIISYSMKDNSQAYSALSEEESSTEDEITYKIADDDTDESEIITAEDVKNNPAKYYGKVVETGGEQGDLTEDYEWQIFYSDGTNIYLISTDYINPNDFPDKNGCLPTTCTDYAGEVMEQLGLEAPKACVFLDDLLNCYEGYTGKSNYENNTAYKWNYLYCEAKNDEVCNNDNLKATSYLLDKEIWESQFEDCFPDDVIEYIIGGPTLEKLTVAINDLYANLGESYEIKCCIPSSESWGYIYTGDNLVDGGIVSYIKATNSSNYLFTADYDHISGYWLASPADDFTGSQDSRARGMAGVIWYKITALLGMPNCKGTFRSTLSRHQTFGLFKKRCENS